jgi:hypothetical protein
LLLPMEELNQAFETYPKLLKQLRRDQRITIKGSSLTITKPDQLERLTA